MKDGDIFFKRNRKGKGPDNNPFVLELDNTVTLLVITDRRFCFA